VIKTVTLWSNGMVMVFDDEGKQMPQYQGTRAEAAEKLKDAFLGEAKFNMAVWHEELSPCSANSFFFACRLK